MTPAMKNILSDLNARFIEVIERLGHSGYSISKELGTSEAVISNVRKGKNPPNIQLVHALLNKYEAIDATWLLTGKGRMFMRSEGGEIQFIPQEPSRDKVSDRLTRLEKLVERSLVVQVERHVLADEAHAELEKQLFKLEKEVSALKRVRQRNT